MNAKLAAMIDAAWSAAVLATLAVILRREITPVLVRARAAMDERAASVAAEAERTRKGHAYLSTIREKLIREEGLIDLDADCGCPETEIATNA